MQSSQSQSRLLVVEDSIVQAEILQRILVENGYAVDIAVNGAAGLAKIKEARPDLVISDIIMPEMSGFELCRLIRVQEKLQDLPVILVTVLSQLEDVLEGLASGADNFVAKPYNESRLISIVREQLARGKLSRKGQGRTDLLVPCRGQEYCIRETPKKILDFFLSTYSIALEKNAELIQAQRDMQELNETLEKKVQERALALIAESSQRQEAEEELARTRLHQEMILNSSGEGILGLDLQGRVSFANPAAAKMLAYEKDQLVGQPSGSVCLFLRPDGSPFPEGECPFRGTLRDGKVRSMEGAFRRQDGTCFPADGTSTAIIQGGKITGAVVTFGDISERKQAEAVLVLQATRLQALLDLHKLADGSQEQLLDFAVEAGLTVTQSEYCFVGLMSEAESVLSIRRWSNKLMAQCAVPDTPSLHRISEAGLWGECVRQRKAVLLNDYQAPHPSKEGLPDGHVQIHRVLAVPVLDGGHTVVIAAVANKGKDYTEDDVSAFTSILNKLWEILRHQRTEAALKESLARTTEVQDGAIEALATVTATRDPYTAGHQRRVARLACAVAQELGFSISQVAGLRVIGLLHDMGKISIPAEILSKPGKLSETEFNIIKSHAQAGYEIIKEIRFPWPVAEVILQHHERLNGSGYPQGLQGDEIVLDAKILAVADVVEAMVSHRPYRPALGIESALEEVTRNKGVLYDSEVVDTCVKLFTEKGFTFNKDQGPDFSFTGYRANVGEKHGSAS